MEGLAEVAVVGRRAKGVPALKMAARSAIKTWWWWWGETRAASKGPFQARWSEGACLSGALLYRFKRVLMR